MRRNIVVIAGTAYAGEIKKSVFSLFNFHAPRAERAAHALLGQCRPRAATWRSSSVSRGRARRRSRNDPARLLIGDDEHGWTADGVFNLEGGCYAKTVKLRATSEPEIFAAAQSPGTVLENLVIGADGVPDFDDISITENTRAAYPLETLPAVAPGGRGGVPEDGGVPHRRCVRRAAAARAADHRAGGLPFPLGLHRQGRRHRARRHRAERDLLGLLRRAVHAAPPQGLRRSCSRSGCVASGATVWLLNTGWTGGAYGTGRRIDLATTRRLLNAALSGELETVATRQDPMFGLAVPVSVEDVDPAVLDPRRAWADPAAYDAAAQRLLALFERNFERFEPRRRRGPVAAGR